MTAIAPRYAGDVEFDQSLPFSVKRYRFVPDWHGTKRPLLPMAIESLREVKRNRPTLIISDQVQSAGVGLPLSRLLSVPHVVFAYGRELNPQKLGWLKKKTFLASDRIVAISGYTRDILTRIHGVAPDRIRLIPPGVDTDDFKPPRSREVAKAAAGFGESQVLLSIGRIEAGSSFKGFDRVIRLLHRLSPTFPDLKLIIVGDGDDLPRLRSLAAGLQVADRVTFEGRVSDKRIRTLYQLADLFVLPSGATEPGSYSAEGFGIVYAEAAASGLPSVGFNVGGVVDAVVDGQTGILVRPDEDALAHAVISLLSDNILRTEMGRRSRHVAIERLSWDSSTLSLRRLIQELAIAPIERRSLNGNQS